MSTVKCPVCRLHHKMVLSELKGPLNPIQDYIEAYVQGAVDIGLNSPTLCDRHIDMATQRIIQLTNEAEEKAPVTQKSS